MSKIDCFVSLVAPMFDDADILESFVNEAWSVLERSYTHFEIVLVDDGSTDDTAEVVADILGRFDFIRVIQLSRRFGREIAILAGLESVIGDFVVIMDIDTDPPELIPEMVERAREGFGIVVGVRAEPEGSLFLRLGAKAFYWYSNKILGFGLPRHSTDFRVLSRLVVNAVIRIKDHVRHLRTYAAFTGYSSSSFPYPRRSRRGRARTRSLREAVGLAVDVVVANSTHPLRLVSIFGVGVSAVSALYAVYVTITYFASANVRPGWATTSLQNSVMFFFLFLLLAVLSEYVGRILNESRDRPLYYVVDEKKSAVIVDEHHANVVSDTGDALATGGTRSRAGGSTDRDLASIRDRRR